MEKLYVLSQNADGQDVEVEVNRDVYETLTKESKVYKVNKRKMERNNVTIETIEDCDIIADTNSLENEYEINEQLGVIFDFLKTCSEKQKRRYCLFVFQGYKVDEIAKMENVPPKRIEKTIAEVRKKIKLYVNYNN